MENEKEIQQLLKEAKALAKKYKKSRPKHWALQVKWLNSPLPEWRPPSKSQRIQAHFFIRIFSKLDDESSPMAVPAKATFF